MDGFGGVLITSNPSFLILQNLRDFKGKQSLEVLNQMNYQIYPYYINKITNYKKNNYPLLLNFKRIPRTFFFFFFFNGWRALYSIIYKSFFKKKSLLGGTNSFILKL